jgi:hypothetical protein
MRRADGRDGQRVTAAGVHIVAGMVLVITLFVIDRVEQVSVGRLRRRDRTIAYRGDQGVAEPPQ